MPIVGDATIGELVFEFFLMRPVIFHLAKFANRPWGRIGKLLECIQVAEQEMLQGSQLLAMLQAWDFEGEIKSTQNTPTFNLCS